MAHRPSCLVCATRPGSCSFCSRILSAGGIISSLVWLGWLIDQINRVATRTLIPSPTQRRRHLSSGNPHQRRLCKPFFYQWIWPHQLHTSRQEWPCAVRKKWSHGCLTTVVDQSLRRGEHRRLQHCQCLQTTIWALGGHQPTSQSTTSSHIRGRLQQPPSRPGIWHSKQRRWYTPRMGIMQWSHSRAWPKAKRHLLVSPLGTRFLARPLLGVIYRRPPPPSWMSSAKRLST